MDTQPPAPVPTRAWQPLSARGVAAFAGASTLRLRVVQGVMALGCAGVIGWFLASAWFPVIQHAAGQLPELGLIEGGVLDWHGPAPLLLGENAFLAIAADPDHTGTARSPAHVYVELGRRDILVFSLFGFVPLKYPSAGAVGFGRDEVRAWWGAWSPFLLAMACGLAAVGLMLSWHVLAWIYAVPVWMLAFFLNRQCSLREAWRLAGAAQMPGAVFMSGTLVLHGLGGLDMVRVLICFGAHFLVAWPYLCFGTLRLPLHPAITASPQNPFQPPFAAEPAAPAPAQEARPAQADPAPEEPADPNPFRVRKGE